MFEFRWHLSGPTRPHEVRLRIHAREGWIGRKTLLLDGKPLWTRNWFGGIHYSFPHPEAPEQRVELRAVVDPPSRQWVPQLTCAGATLPEEGGCPPPLTPDRPKTLAVVVGLTYLMMLMTLIMLPHIWRMLEAGRGHSDTRTYVLEVVGPGSEAGPRLQRGALPPARCDQPYAASIAVLEGSPPYAYELFKGVLPAGLSFDPTTATVQGTPAEAGDQLVWVRVTDGLGGRAEWPYVLSVAPAEQAEPRIVTPSLPAAVEGRLYAASFEVVGGAPFVGDGGIIYKWVVNKRKLPEGLKADEKRGALDGTPVSGSAGPYPITVRVGDSAYSPLEDIAPWLAPFAATAVCLLGFWNMRRWSVLLYALLIVGQLTIGLFADWPALNIPGLVIQALVFTVGAGSLGRMR